MGSKLGQSEGARGATGAVARPAPAATLRPSGRGPVAAAAMPDQPRLTQRAIHDRLAEIVRAQCPRFFQFANGRTDDVGNRIHFEHRPGHWLRVCYESMEWAYMAEDRLYRFLDYAGDHQYVDMEIWSSYEIYLLEEGGEFPR